jgi:hypothetical protein
MVSHEPRQRCRESGGGSPGSVRLGQLFARGGEDFMLAATIPVTSQGKVNAERVEGGPDGMDVPAHRDLRRRRGP